MIHHAYVHVPFCPQICPFCSFHVLRRAAGAVDAYLERLEVEAATAAERYSIELRSTYLGGGTPSILRVAEMDRLLSSLRRRVGDLGTEVTLEVHPSTASPERFAAWRDLGITRFSIGVESTDDAVLRRLGRSHDAASALAAVDAALAAANAGDTVVSVDLMSAIDGQDIVSELERIASLGVDHVSCYTLTIEAGTPFERTGVTVDPDVAADAFAAAGEVLGRAGLRRYEVSNHARPGAECVHNRAYWQSGWWLGLGPSAAAHLPPIDNGGGDPADSVGVRAVNAPFGEWLAGAPPESEALSPQAWVADALVAGLRMVKGVDLDRLSRRSGVNVAVAYAARIEELAAEGLVRFVKPAVLAATRKGLPILDTVTARLLAPSPECG